ncbi:MAG TPA: phosphoenolpyruvate carboxylase [Candidatus Dormibacteraeota bacterium]|nr:phosphoenolpyruvate carboxylase [Candidatus Dormibacteraeota bacterium]
MPAPLRREVRLLGELLGQVLAEYGGPGLLADVENLRRTVIVAREREDQDAAPGLVAAWPIDRAEQVARAFTCYFQLINLAEERHRARALRERDRGSEPLAESLEQAVAEIRAGYGEDTLRELLDDLVIHPVLTAHPTESRRRAVVAAISRVGAQLEALDDPRVSAREAREARRRLLEEIDLLWRTGQLRSTQVRALDEVRSVMAIFDETLFRAVPEIYRDLDAALGPGDAGLRPPIAPAFVRLGSWVGGDRDGNPAVTAQVTVDAMEIQADHVLRGLETALLRVGRSLTADLVTTPPDQELGARLAGVRLAQPTRLADLAARSPSEQHRQYLLYAADRVRATRLADATISYRTPAELLDDLRAVQRSLAAAGAARLAYGELQNLVWQVETFGFHLAELEVRQHSKVHDAAIGEINGGGRRSSQTEEVLATFRAIKQVQDRFGLAACRRYIVSFTRDSIDIANVYALAEAAMPGGPAPEIEVIPLFETVEDLGHAPLVLDRMVELEPVRRRMETTGRLEVMLGYSDSTKEVGPVSASLALYEAQAKLVRWAASRGVRLTLFHGRGGALGRGGGPANRAIRAQAPGSIAGHFKVTEQGEVVFARYSNPAIARRHLEQVASAVLMASLPDVDAVAERAEGRFHELGNRIEEPARGAYRGLVESGGFEQWFSRVSPIDELGRMRLGSRPARRGGSHKLEELRAIPWVFAWSQMRLNLPGWYGLGSGMAAADLAELREAYAEWPLFNVLLDNAEMSLAKTDRRIAERYLDLGGRADLSGRILSEYDLTVDRVLAVTGHSRLLENHRVLSWAVELRNPYVDALSHIQLHTLEALRGEAIDQLERARLEQVLLVTVNGVAAGLQNTG